MEYKPQHADAAEVRIKPRIIIHGGAGNIQRKGYPADKYDEYRNALLTIVRSTDAFIKGASGGSEKQPGSRSRGPSALDIAAHAVVQLEDCPLFNSGHGAVFTRDGINQLEASVMVSRGRAKRGVGVSGLRHVRNPILLAKSMLERGDADLGGQEAGRPSVVSVKSAADDDDDQELDVPSAQGHTMVWGRAAEQLARAYGLEMVEPGYYFTQQRWDEHIRALEREKQQRSTSGTATATWSPDEYLPQGTCGAVALDDRGVICAATSTGGMTNKLTGRIGDTPVPGAGFWAEEWEDESATGSRSMWDRAADALARSPAGITFAGPLKGLLADCLPTPFLYTPVSRSPNTSSTSRASTVTTRAAGLSGTGNGDSFLRTAAAHTVACLARLRPVPAREAVAAVAGPGGELQRSAGGRWGRAGEGEGGVIGVECVVDRDTATGRVVGARGEVLMAYNCGGMYRAWIDDGGEAVMSVWTNGGPDEDRP